MKFSDAEQVSTLCSLAMLLPLLGMSQPICNVTQAIDLDVPCSIYGYTSAYTYTCKHP